MKYWYIVFEVRGRRFGTQSKVGMGFCSDEGEFPINKAINSAQDFCHRTHENPEYEYDMKYFNALVSWVEISEDQYKSLGKRVLNERK